MKNKKLLIVGIVLLLFLLIVGIVIGFNFNKNEDNEEVEEEKVNTEIKYVGISNGTYYIMNASKKIAFEVDSKDINYSLLDSNNEEVKSKIKKIEDKYYIVSNKSYKEGASYTLNLNNGKFLAPELSDATRVIFSIERDKVAEYKLYDDVKVLDKYDVSKVGNKKTIDTSYLGNLSTGDIFITSDSKGYNGVYKISSIDGDTALLKEPELAEVYEEFDFYDEIEIDFTNMKSLVDDNSMEDVAYYDDYGKVEAVTLASFMETPVYQFLENETKKTGNDLETGVKITPNGNKLDVEITVNVKANGKGFLGIDTLAEHDVGFKFTFELTSEFLVDIKKNESMNVSLSMTEVFDFEIKLSLAASKEGFSELKDKEYDKTVSDIINRICGEKSDSASGRATLGAIEVPTSVPGLNLFMAVYFQVDIDLLMEATANERVTITESFGITSIDGNFVTFSTISKPVSSYKLEAFGKLTAKVGMGIEAGISIISKDFANISFADEIGIYGEALAVIHSSFDSSSDKLNQYHGGMIECGFYMDLKVSASINVLFKKKLFSKEYEAIKEPFFKIGHEEIIAELIVPEKVQIVDGKITVPIVKKNYYDLDARKAKEEKIDVSKLEFRDSNGNVLKIEDGKIAISGEEVVITVVYKLGEDDNITEYTKTFIATKKSLYEGEISRDEAEAILNTLYDFSGTTESGDQLNVIYGYSGRVKDKNGNYYHAFRMMVDNVTNRSFIQYDLISVDGKKRAISLEPDNLTDDSVVQSIYSIEELE